MLANGDIFHGDHHPVSVVEGRRSRNLANPADLSNRIRYYTTGADYTHVKYWGNFELIEASGIEVSISYKYKGTGNPWWSISQYDENGKFLSGQTQSAYSSTGSTRRVVGKYVSFSLWDGTDLKAENNPFYDIQVEFGETLGSTPTEYVPYTSMETIFKPIDLKKSGTSLTFEQSYNHSAEVEVAGKSEQVQLSGKNLYCDIPERWTKPVNYWCCPVTLEQGKKYTLSVGDPSGGGCDTRTAIGLVKAGRIYAEFSPLYLAYNNYVRPFPTVTVDSTFTDPAIVMYLYGNDTPEKACRCFQVQLEQSATATPYEPYCGGIPSPNPDYPQPIESIESVELLARGRNLYERNNNLDGYAYLVEGETYTFSGTVSAIRDYRAQFWFYESKWAGLNKPASYVVLLGDRVVGNRLSGTFTAKMTGRFPLRTFNEYDNLVDIQIEQGTIAHPYEPYHSTTRTIDLQGHQLRSLPDGTHDELRVKRDGSVELVKNVSCYNISSYNWLIYQRDSDPFWYTTGSLDGSQRDVHKDYFLSTIGVDYIGLYQNSNMTRLYMKNGSVLSGQPTGELLFEASVPQTIALPPIEPLPTYWPTTVIYDSEGNGISAYVKVVD